MTISYIWRAEKTEVAMEGAQYIATSTKQAPASISAVEGAPGLRYAESIYGAWELIGTAKGPCYSNDYGSFIELDTPAMGGRPVEVEEVVRMNWYSKA